MLHFVLFKNRASTECSWSSENPNVTDVTATQLLDAIRRNKLQGKKDGKKNLLEKESTRKAPQAREEVRVKLVAARTANTSAESARHVGLNESPAFCKSFVADADGNRRGVKDVSQDALALCAPETSTATATPTEVGDEEFCYSCQILRVGLRTSWRAVKKRTRFWPPSASAEIETTIFKRRPWEQSGDREVVGSTQSTDRVKKDLRNSMISRISLQRTAANLASSASPPTQRKRGPGSFQLRQSGQDQCSSTLRSMESKKPGSGQALCVDGDGDQVGGRP